MFGSRPRFSAELPVSATEPDLGEVRLVAVDLHEVEREAVSWEGYRCGEVPLDFMALDEGALLVLPWADIELEQVVAAAYRKYKRPTSHIPEVSAPAPGQRFTTIGTLNWADLAVLSPSRLQGSLIFRPLAVAGTRGTWLAP